MTPETLALLHAAAFAGHSRSWSVDEFTSLLESPYCYVTSNDYAFALGRAIAGEAELLTLASNPAHHRQGHAQNALQLFEKQAICRGATRAFLEVAADNVAAIALYSGAGYQLNGIRPNYYRRTGAPAIDAHTMARDLVEN